MRIRWVLGTAIAAGVPLLPLAGCGSADVAREPVQFTDRAPLPSCGTFVVTGLSLTEAQGDMVDCILAASESGTPGELEYRRPGTDCCELRYVLRVLGREDVVMYTVEDRRDWTRWECELIARSADPPGLPIGTSCGESLRL